MSDTTVLASDLEGEVREVKMGSLFDDVGATGLKRSVGIIDEEFLPALRGNKASQVFREMSMNDPIVGALLFTIEMLLRQVEWTVVGQDESPEQSEAVKFVEECMDDMSHSWGDLIAEILSCVTYGWSWHEIVYKKRVGPFEKDPKRRSKFTDGKIGWRKMPIRAQETLFRWVFDDHDGIKGLMQIPPPRYDIRTLSIEKGLLFRVGAHKGNPEGLSMLRRGYRPWFFKKRLEEFEAIGVERDLAGLPVAKVPSEYMLATADPQKKAVYNAFKKLVSNVRRDEHEGVVIPSDANPETKLPLFEFELMSSGGARTFDTNALIGRYELNILFTCLGDFLKLGHEGEGSYAMHVDKTGVFRAALNTVAKSISDVFNRYAIPRLFELNNWKLDSLPQIKPSNVDPPNLTELTQFMTGMAGLGMTFFPDPDLDKFLRETAHLPGLSEDAEALQRQMAAQQNAMAFVDTHLQAESVKQQASMVGDQGMTPDQAMMASQQPTPEMMQNDPSMQMQMQQGQADLEAKGQQMQLDQAAGQQKLAQSDAEHQQRMKQTTEQGALQTKMTADQAKRQQAQGADEDKRTKAQGDAELAHAMKKMQLEIAALQAKLGIQQQADTAKVGVQQAADKQKLTTQQQLDQAKLSAAKKASAAKPKTPVKKALLPFQRS